MRPLGALPTLHARTSCPRRAAQWFSMSSAMMDRAEFPVQLKSEEQKMKRLCRRVTTRRRRPEYREAGVPGQRGQRLHNAFGFHDSNPAREA